MICFAGTGPATEIAKAQDAEATRSRAEKR